jgi:membrane-bound lytic murein transglycosylase C
MRKTVLLSVVCSALLADTSIINNGQMRFDSIFDSDKISDKLNKLKIEQSYENYRSTIEHYAKVCNIDKSLIAAIIKVESNFDKNAISATNAIGLMQIKLDQAVADVLKSNYGRSDTPTKAQLLEPQLNISIGSQYLSLMSNKYFKDIKNQKTLEYCLIAGYNAGAGTVLRTFNDDKAVAQVKINALSPDEVLQILSKNMASEQGKRYIQKVLEAKSEFEAKQSNLNKNIIYVNSFFDGDLKR